MLAICKKIPVKAKQKNKTRNGLPHGKFTLCRIYEYNLNKSNYGERVDYFFTDNTGQTIFINHFNKWFAAIV